LKENRKFEVVAEANSAEEMLKLLSEYNVDVLLTDITMPYGMSGYDLSLQVKKEFPHIKIIALSMSEDGSMISKMIEEAKVSGYLPKTSGQKELFAAIEIIAADGKYFSKTVLQQYDTYKKMRSKNEELNLTARELQIINCIIKHYSNKKIADELFISERTVETHRKNIYRKTNTKCEAALIQFIKEHNLIN
jgi:two-component system, NarL family, nitrate/nitrite response regulator NarL